MRQRGTVFILDVLVATYFTDTVSNWRHVAVWLSGFMYWTQYWRDADDSCFSGGHPWNITRLYSGTKVRQKLLIMATATRKRKQKSWKVCRWHNLISFWWHSPTFAYFNHVHWAYDVGVETFLHLLGTGLQKGKSEQNPSIVDQQVETLGPHLWVHQLGTLFYATKVSGIWPRVIKSGATTADSLMNINTALTIGSKSSFCLFLVIFRATESLYQDGWCRFC